MSKVAGRSTGESFELTRHQSNRLSETLKLQRTTRQRWVNGNALAAIQRQTKKSRIWKARRMMRVGDMRLPESDWRCARTGRD